ncbi:PTS IIA-like nitrogen-regulatory protein PtsN [Marinicauda pacifica]|jgi:PTS system nitrogen regulatory IIA component|uniref:PTS IIA-like nitrogen regulatory protein PtsN n=1 Tax=Marinicauda pacifica TaxID=1133559 RepID=A0A4V3RZ88_9PROT|nr:MULTISPECIES: PTS IIA-like nitrogen regulatory protein PtsN [Marinicauda]TGY93299.1 PTS IIA-like nitrogen regulatory protein PtsN [Marinicauda pacifica]GGE44594.1 PTS IIA-like nitrogen-regulatory protein PtsN [Marinicauda pacifica]
MTLSDLIPSGGVAVDLAATSRKQALHALSELAHRRLDIPARPLLEAVMEREKLGSTGVGDGVAIPHARLPGVERTCGLFARLKQSVDFDAVDGHPVDLVFMLIAPEDSGAEHLKALARVARMFRREEIRRALRAAPDADAAYAILDGSVVNAA